jgi:hypothetical protein
MTVVKRAYILVQISHMYTVVIAPGYESNKNRLLESDRRA